MLYALLYTTPSRCLPLETHRDRGPCRASGHATQATCNAREAQDGQEQLWATERRDHVQRQAHVIDDVRKQPPELDVLVEPPAAPPPKHQAADLNAREQQERRVTES